MLTFKLTNIHIISGNSNQQYQWKNWKFATCSCSTKPKNSSSTPATESAAFMMWTLIIMMIKFVWKPVGSLDEKKGAAETELMFFKIFCQFKKTRNAKCLIYL